MIILIFQFKVAQNKKVKILQMKGRSTLVQQNRAALLLVLKMVDRLISFP